MIDILRPEDLLHAGRWREVTAEVAAIVPAGELVCESGRRIDKPALRFKGKRKIMFVSPTISRTLHYVTGMPFGQETIGHTIRLGVRVVPAFGGLALSIRVIPPADMVLPRSLTEAIGTLPKSITTSSLADSTDKSNSET